MTKNNKKVQGRQQKRKSTESNNVDLSEKNKKDSILPIILVLTLVIITFFPTFFNGFTNWDDNLQVTDNADITSLSWHHLKNIFTSFYAAMYQPLTTFSFAVLFKFFGLKPFAYHFFSLLLHLSNTFLVCKITGKLTEKKEIVYGVTLLFALNPMQTEAVAWVSATSTLLYSMFFLLSVNAYMVFIQRENSKKNYYFSFLFFLLALLSKSAAVTLPLILLLCDYFLQTKISKKDLLNKIPFFTLSVIFGIITIIGRKYAGDIVDVTKYQGFVDSILLIIYSLSFYMTSIFAPLKMSAFHPYPDKSGGMLPVLFYLLPLLLIGITTFLVIVKRHKKEIIFGVLFFLLSISVMIELIPVGTQVVKERYTYVPCIGLYFAFLMFLYNFFKKNAKLKRLIHYGFAAVLILFMVLSFMRTRTWKDSFSLWNDVIKKYPKCALAYSNRGTLYHGPGKYDHAVADFTKAIESDPEYAGAYYNLGVIHGEKGLFEKAISEYTKAVELKPDYVEAYLNRGRMYGAMGAYDKAVFDYTKAIELKPDYAEAYSNRGVAYFNQKLYDKAIKDNTKAIELLPDEALCYYNRGNIFYAQGIFEKAIISYTKAIELKPDYAGAYYNLGVVYLNQRIFDKAITNFTKAIELKSDYPEALFNRGLIYYDQKLTDQACQDFRKAAELGHKDAKSFAADLCK